MRKKRWLRLLVVGLVAFSVTATSLGGAFASAALAAPPEENGLVAGGDGSGNKAVVGGLLALGLIAMLSRGGPGDGDGTAPGKASAPVPVSNPAPVQKSQPISVPVTKPASVSQSRSAPGGVPTSNPAPTGLSTDEQKAFELLNADRAANGLPPLRANYKLTALARDYGRDMAKRGFFSHYNPEGQSPFDRMRAYGIKYGYAGENLAINTSVAGAEKAFMNSPGHRANILNSHYTQVGIGVQYGANGAVYVVQEYIDG